MLMSLAELRADGSTESRIISETSPELLNRVKIFLFIITSVYFIFTFSVPVRNMVRDTTIVKIIS